LGLDIHSGILAYNGVRGINAIFTGLETKHITGGASKWSYPGVKTRLPGHFGEPFSGTFWGFQRHQGANHFVCACPTMREHPLQGGRSCVLTTLSRSAYYPETMLGISSPKHRWCEITQPLVVL